MTAITNGRPFANRLTAHGITAQRNAVALLLVTLACGSAPPEPESSTQPRWTHISSVGGELPAPGPSEQQTASLVLDVDQDGVNDFLIGTRVMGPSLVWFRRGQTGWTKYVVDPAFLRIEAGGAYHDIDADGDLDVVFGGDGGENHIWWWENPYPDYDPETPWVRREIKASGGRKHHDQAFGDFDGDGKTELAAWSQRDRQLLLFEIPGDPAGAETWPSTVIYEWDGGDEHEGLVAADVNQDGVTDLVGGGRWFEHSGESRFAAHLIDDALRFTRAAAGQLVDGGWLEVVFAPGDADGPLQWFEWNGDEWIAHKLGDADLIHGHSLALADVNGDGRLDIFSAEMGKWTNSAEAADNPQAKMRIFYGDGEGRFVEQEAASGFANHESRVADLDGDGDLDILAKPYNWETPRIDVWLNESAPR